MPPGGTRVASLGFDAEGPLAAQGRIFVYRRIPRRGALLDEVRRRGD